MGPRLREIGQKSCVLRRGIQRLNSPIDFMGIVKKIGAPDTPFMGKFTEM